MKRKLLSMLALLCLTVTSAWAETTVTFTSDDLMDAERMGENSITKNGVTVSANRISEMGIYGPGSFSTSEGNFTRIEISADMVEIRSEGWLGNTWTGNASTVSFEGEIMGRDITIVCTISDSGGSEEPEPVNSGTCGDGVTWALNEGVLTISGTGAMANFDGNAPWASQSSSITSLVIETGVTRIGNKAFDGYSSLATVSIPSSVTSIGTSAFSGCSGLATINIPEGVTSIESYAFSNCTSLTSVNIPASVTTIQYHAFYHCTNLASVTLNSSPCFGAQAFTTDYENTLPATFTMNLTAHEGAKGEFWTTLYNNQYNFQVDANTEVFKVALSGAELTLNKVEDGKVTKNTAVVLKTTGGRPVLTPTSSSSSDAQSNSLNGVANSNGQGTQTDGTFYVLNKGSKGVGFYKLASGNSVGNGKAYLTYSGALAREFFLFDEATGIEAIDNGQLTINNVVYDLQGRRVAQPAKGLYIVNGKKYIKK